MKVIRLRQFARLLATPLAALLVIFVALALHVPAATAAEFETGPSPSVPAGTTVDDDLYLFGGDAEIHGVVTRDAVVSAGTLEVDGRIGGNLAAAVGSAVVRGEVDRSVRVTAGNVRVLGRVGGDVVVAGGTVTIEPGATVGGDVVVAGGTVDIRGQVAGDVRGNAGTVTIGGRVDGDVRVGGDRVRLLPAARVAGTLRYRSRNEAEVAPGAVVSGPTVRRPPARFVPGDNLLIWLSSAIFRLLCGLVAGVAVVLLLPRSAPALADALRTEPLAPFLAGLGLAIGVPIAVAVLIVTVVGVPLALIVLALYLAALYLSQVVVGLAIGRFLLPASWDTASRGFNLLAMTLGVILLAALRLVPIPYLGLAVAAFTAVLGLGAIVMGMRRWRRAV